MGPYDYIVSRIDGDYAVLLRTDDGRPYFYIPTARVSKERLFRCEAACREQCSKC